MASRTTRTAIKCGCFVVAFALGCHGSAFATVFSVGDETTYGQSEWGTTGSLAQNTLLADFSAVYGGAVDVGDLSKFYMEFDGGTAIDAYLPQTGPVGVLDGVLLDPTSSA